MSRPKSLSLLSVEALFKLRDDVAAALGSDYAEVGRIAIYGKSAR